MMKRLIVLSLVSFLMHSPEIALAQGREDSTAVDKVRGTVARIGICPVKVTVFLADNSKLKGCILTFAEDYFTVVDSKTGGATRVNYGNVLRVKRQSVSSWRRTWLPLGVAVALPYIIVALALHGDN